MAVAAVILAALLITVFLFRVQKIDVYGNESHTSEEITAGLLEEVIGDNALYLMWKYRNGSVPDTLPFLNSVQVQMKSPSHIAVTVSEKELAGYVDQGGAAYFDMNGVVLQITDEIYGDVPIITGVSMEDAVLYQKLPTESASQRQTITGLLQLLKDYGLEVQEIRFGENMEITAFIGGVEARLGQNEFLEEKVANLKSILEKLEKGECGVLHLESFTGGTENVTFSPSDETEPPEEETQADAAGDSASAGDTGDVSEGSDDAAESSGYGDGSAQAGEGTGDGVSDSTADGSSDDAADGADDASQEDEQAGGDPFMAFDSSGTLRYDVRVVNGVAVDGNGDPVPGCTVNEQGYVVDAYMNVIDPATGQPIQ